MDVPELIRGVRFSCDVYESIMENSLLLYMNHLPRVELDRLVVLKNNTRIC